MEQLPLALYANRLAPGFQRRLVILAPAQSLHYAPADWRDALILLQQGQLELEGVQGHRQEFAAGSLLWLDQLSICALHNPGTIAAILLVFSRVKNS